jgi:putative effector of murein hydrolase
MNPMRVESLPSAAFWSAITIALYVVAKAIYRRWPRGWTIPLVVAPALLLPVMMALHESYRAYISGTQWLVALLGPVMVAFAVPVYEHRTLIRTNWRLLVIGVIVGTTTSIVSAWAMSTMLGLNVALRLSLLPRSMSTPFAMTVASDIGGIPELTAVFAVLTAVLGAAIGEALLGILPLRSAVARGTLFGAGAHGVGVARAREMGQREGSVASLMLVLVGVTNVLLAVSLAQLLQHR